MDCVLNVGLLLNLFSVCVRECVRDSRIYDMTPVTQCQIEE